MSYSLALKFDRPSEDFALGFEAGRFWEIIKTNYDEFSQVVHIKNAEMLIRVAEGDGRSIRSKELDDTWMEITFGAAGSGDY
jgi:hypothetical protein